MSRRSRAGRGGFAAANVVLALALLALAASIYAPFGRQRAFEARLELAIADVEALRARALSHRAEHGSWPSAAELQVGFVAGGADAGEGGGEGPAAGVADGGQPLGPDGGQPSGPGGMGRVGATGRPLTDGPSPEPGAAAEPSELPRERYRLAWSRWRTVRPAATSGGGVTSPSPSAERAADPRPPEVFQLGNITVRTDDQRLLAGLLQHFGGGVSFVRDSSWTLLLAPAPVARRTAATIGS